MLADSHLSSQRVRRDLAIIVVGTLMAQGVSLYARGWFNLWGDFYYLTLSLRLLLPLVCGVWLLRIPWRDLAMSRSSVQVGSSAPYFAQQSQ